MTDHFFRGNTAIPRELPWEERIELFWRGYEDALEEGLKVGLDVFFGLEQNFTGDEYLVYGLSKEYEVSCEELDYLNDIAKEEGVTGSRIMGGGFGGCTINLISDELVNNFKKVVKEKFKAKYGKEPIIIDVVIGDGARKLC